MPFITEECAQRLPNPAPSLQRRDWPEPQPWWTDAPAQRAREGVDEVLDLVQALRAARQEAGVPSASRERQPLHLATGGVLGAAEVVRLVEALAPFDAVDVPPEGLKPVRVIAGGAHATLFVGSAAADDTARLRKQLGTVASRIESLQGRLNNRGFTDGAPPALVEQTRRQLDEARAEHARLQALLGENAA
jgi:valyl-tRNA synthetase